METNKGEMENPATQPGCEVLLEVFLTENKYRFYRQS